MKKLLSYLLIAFYSTSLAFADGDPGLNIADEDGSPSLYPYQLRVTNGSLTDNGDGTASLSTGAGGGGTITQVGNITTGISAVSSSTNATFGNLQAAQIGNVSRGDASFAGLAADVTTLYVSPNNDRVGIGTTTPGAKLEIFTPSNTLGGFTIRNTDNSNRTLASFIATGNDGNLLLYDDTETLKVVIDGGTQNSYITGGNFGLGIAVPTQKAHVEGQGFFADSSASPDPGDGSGSGIRIGFSTVTDTGYVSALQTGVATKNLALQQSGGNVGIGTTAPTHLLHVTGSITATTATFLSLNSTRIGNTTAADASFTQIRTPGYTQALQGSYVSANAADGINATSNNLQFRSNGVDQRMIIYSNGNIGMGTAAAPTNHKLSVVGGITGGNASFTALNATVIGNSSGADATFTNTTISGLTVSRCVETDASGKLVSAAGVCAASGAGDIDQVGNVLSGAAGTSSANNVTFGNLQATQIGNVSKGDASFAGLAVDTTTLYVNPNNNLIGIGIAVPATKLDIKGDDNSTILNIAGGTSVGSFQVGADASGDGFAYVKNVSNVANIVLDADSDSYVNTGANFGIGDTTPDAKLDVEGANTALRITTSTGAAFLDMYDGATLKYQFELTTNNLLQIDFGADNIMTIDGGTRMVGINTNSPNHTLQVGGAGSFTATTATFSVITATNATFTNIGRTVPGDASFTAVSVSNLTNGQCVQYTGGKLAPSGGSCGGVASGDATFDTIQSPKIGNIAPGDATFNTVTIVGGGAISGVSGRLLTFQSFTSSGTWTRPTGTSFVIVEVVGGGAGGGSSNASTRSGSGGGGGGYTKELIENPGTSETVTIGGAGTGGTVGNDDATGGGTSSFGSFCSSTGGAKGIEGGTGTVAGGAGGAGSGGDINMSGQAGGRGVIAVSPSGAGGSSAGGFGIGGAPTATGTGYDGTNYGGGGSGSYNGSAIGGNGTAGIVVVYSYS